MSRALAAALPAIGLAWAAALIASPLVVSSAPSASATAPAALVYLAGGRICHQQRARSFHLQGVQMPVCARCLALYVSGAFGATLGWLPLRRRAAAHRDRWWLLVCALPTGGTWALEAAGLVAFSNGARAIAAVPLGVAAGWIFVRRLREEAAAPFA